MKYLITGGAGFIGSHLIGKIITKADKVIVIISKPTKKPRVQGVFILFNGECGTPEAIIDSQPLSNWKTACDSALGSRFLSKRSASSLLMIGAGTLA